MNSLSPDDSQPLQVETTESLLDALRAHPEWDERQRDEQMDRLIARFPADRIVAALRPRLKELHGADGECLLRLVEANAAPDLLRSLAEAISNQPDLPPERAWDALAILDAEELLDSYPDLAERWDELNEMLGDEGENSLGQLAEQLESDPGEAWLAQGCRPRAGSSGRDRQWTAEGSVGPGLISFLRLLAFTRPIGPRPWTSSALQA